MINIQLNNMSLWGFLNKNLEIPVEHFFIGVIKFRWKWKYTTITQKISLSTHYYIMGFFSFIWLALPIFVRKLKGRWFSFFYLERCCYFRKRMRICLDNHSITQTQKRNRYCIVYILFCSLLLFPTISLFTTARFT